MNGKMFVKGAKVIRNVFFKNSEVICATAALTFFGITVVETVKAVQEIEPIIEKKKEEYKMCSPDDKEAQKEVVWEGIKESAPHAAKPIIAGTMCAGFIIAGPMISAKKIGSLAAAYSIVEGTAETMDKKIEEIAGKKKADEVREAVAKERAEQFNGEGIVQTGHGDQLFFMMSTGVWFRSSCDYIRLVFSRINERLNDYEEIDLNDAIDDLGMERCSLANLVGWCARDGERAEVDLRQTGMYVDKITGKEEAAIFVSTNETPLTNVYGDLDWHKHY